ncbi:GtrA family protein [Okibacterium fritillariae]|uniref:GtrA family protein n=1 Tax=Okibacterium fritillariae TaxID=123320 RepID=UPI00405549F6
MPRSRALIEIARGSSFLFIGGIAFLVDAGLYNLLVYWGGHGPLHDLPLLAKIISIATASAATYVGNKLLTYRDRPTRVSVRQIAIFITINLIAGGLQLACLGFSRYVLHLDDPVADNIFGTFIGQILATAFRYVTYGRFVFPAESAGSTDAPASSEDADGRDEPLTGTAGA